MHYKPNFSSKPALETEPELGQEVFVRLANQQANLEVVLESMCQGVCLFDAEENVLLSNRKFAEILGISMQEMGLRPSLQTLIKERFEANSVPTESTSEYIFDCFNPATRQEYKSQILPLKSGTVVNERHVPFENGGWLTSIEDMTEIYKLKKQLEYTAHHDHLTGLPNRHFLRSLVEKFDNEQPETVCVYYLDINDFKPINDTYGHLIGDQFLIALSKRLQALTRKEIYLARLGGDEFVFVQRGQMSIGQAREFAKIVSQTISRPFVVDDKFLKVSVSIGISISSDLNHNFDALLDEADKAMYSAKSCQIENISFWNSDRLQLVG